MNTLGIASLGTVPETLLIPLAARMIAPDRHPDLQFRDGEAARIGTALGFDPARFADDTGSMRGSVIRAQWFDRIAGAFIAANPTGLCVSIGSGLDDRPARIRLPATVDWIDADFAEVVRLREALISRRDNVRIITVSETEPLAWIDGIGWQPGRPAPGVGGRRLHVSRTGYGRRFAPQARRPRRGKRRPARTGRRLCITRHGAAITAKSEPRQDQGIVPLGGGAAGGRGSDRARSNSGRACRYRQALWRAGLDHGASAPAPDRPASLFLRTLPLSTLWNPDGRTTDRQRINSIQIRRSGQKFRTVGTRLQASNKTSSRWDFSPGMRRYRGSSA